MIETIFVFEGESHDTDHPDFHYDSSLSLHKTLAGAEKELDAERNSLTNNGYIEKFYEKVEINGEINVVCILEDEFLAHRTLSISEWLIRE